MAKRQYPELGDQLRDAADERGISIPQLAELAKVSTTGVRLAFQGSNITLDTLLALAAVLDLREIRVGPLKMVLQKDELDVDTLRTVKEQVTRTGQFVENLLREAERREKSAKLVAEIGADARERLKGVTTGSGKAR